MCDPASIAILTQAAGGILNANAQQTAGEANKELLQHNQQIALYKAKVAEAQGAFTEAQIKQQIGQLIGSQRSGFAHGGLALDSGTALDIGLDTARTGALDVAQARLNAANIAWGYRVEAKSLGYQANLAKKSGTQAALGTLLGTGGNLYSTYSLTGNG